MSSKGLVESASPEIPETDPGAEATPPARPDAPSRNDVAEEVAPVTTTPPEGGDPPPGSARRDNVGTVADADVKTVTGGNGAANASSAAAAGESTEASEARPASSDDGHAVVDSAPDESLGTTHAERVVVTVLVAVCLAMLGWRWATLSGWGHEPIEIDRQTPLFHEVKLDANAATWVEFMQLEGIGEVLARRIVDDRDRHGPFERVEDLQRVSGIGPKTVEKLRPWIVVESRPTRRETDD